MTDPAPAIVGQLLDRATAEPDEPVDVDELLPVLHAAQAGGQPVPAGLLHGLVDAWLTNRRLSHNTRDAYRRDVRDWLRWCTGADVDPLATRFTTVNAWARQLEATIDARTGRPYTPATVARKLSAVSSWYRFLVGLDLMPRNPAATADRPRVDPDHTTTIGLSEREAAALIAAADADPYPAAARTRALIRFLVGLGARVSDATRTQLRDLGADAGYRTVDLHLKGGKTRRRRLPDQVGIAIDAMLTDRAAAGGVTVEQLPPTSPLFATGTGRPMDRREILRLVRRLARAAGIPAWERISPHSLRHTFVTIARRRGASLEDVQDAAGHADPRTTRRYDRDRYRLDRDPSTLVAYAVTPGSTEAS